ncbi:2,4-dienoyl-CoA reductase [Sporobacter termitidis DSM 10068]|uniref:2,4-dienoyl-CoA reductase n=1 Tax=Sporobacter termitidis DSM 10068 TaxID=1123282 RepID=A0A1M5XUL1_9FIRM|nr:FAD-dependent oxidoreductase [Sporobacter termitidis]SHI03487.1 2,4-dienoyl-CoA reductase [Sporobacter termitidis DSM 10068]
MNFKYLFTPYKIGKCEIPNRLVVTAMATNYCTNQGLATERYIRYHEERAKGGWGLIITENYAVNEHAMAFQGIGGMWNDEQVASHRQLTERIHRYNTKIFCQLYHAGRQTFSLVNGGVQPVAPSPIACPVNREMPRELTTHEIHGLVTDFGTAAERVKKAGFDGLELHAGNGYLIAGFMSSYENRRTDEYGGCFTNRMRFLREVLEEVRSRVGSVFPVSVRFAAEEHELGGRDLAEARMVAALLEEMGVDMINCSNGVYGSYNLSQISTMYMPHGWTIKNAAELKKVVNIPVLGVNRITDPLMADQFLSMGYCDFVGMARASLADPFLPQKALHGQFQSIRTCIGCLQGCVGSLITGSPCRCLVNPECGHEFEYDYSAEVTPKKVLVIGGGVAGMEAAIAAARRGHKVTLWEKSDRLGGQFISASYPPGKGEFATYIGCLNYYVKETGVCVEFNKEATEESIKAFGPDSVLLATGAVPNEPKLPGVNRANVVYAEQVLLGIKTVEGRIVIAGGGETGLETALYLAASERGDISVVTSLEKVAKELNGVKRVEALKMAATRGIEFITNTNLVEICENGVLLEKGGETRLLPCDCVVIAKGYHSNNSLKDELAFLGDRLVTIGDAVKARNALEASASGCKAGYYA